MKNDLSEYQIEELQADVASLKKDVREILENDLPHIHILGILAVIAITQALK